MRHRRGLCLTFLLLVPFLVAAAGDMSRRPPGLKNTTLGQFRVSYSPELEASVPAVVSRIETIWADIEGFFGVPARGRVVLEMITGFEYATTYPEEAAQRIDAFCAGTTIVMIYGTTPGRSTVDLLNEQILIHEAVHAYGSQRYRGPDGATGVYPPKWFIEGIAMYLQTRLHRNAPLLNQVKVRVHTPLETGEPHGNGLQAVRFLVERRGEASLGRVLELLNQRVRFVEAITEVYGMTIPELQDELRRW
jgi:hypothetical protein